MIDHEFYHRYVSVFHVLVFSRNAQFCKLVKLNKNLFNFKFFNKTLFSLSIEEIEMILLFFNQKVQFLFILKMSKQLQINHQINVNFFLHPKLTRVNFSKEQSG